MIVCRLRAWSGSGPSYEINIYLNPLKSIKLRYLVQVDPDSPCTNRPIVFQLQIEKRKSKNDSLSDFSFFNSKTKMNHKVVFRLLYTY